MWDIRVYKVHGSAAMSSWRPKHTGNVGLPVRLGHGHHVVDQCRCGEIGDLLRLRWDRDLSPCDVPPVTGGVPQGSSSLKPSASPRLALSSRTHLPKVPAPIPSSRSADRRLNCDSPEQTAQSPP